MLQITNYKDVPSKSVFKVLKPEFHRGVLVKNNGIYVKVAQSHSVDVATKADCIFEPNTPCRVVSKHAERFQ